MDHSGHGSAAAGIFALLASTAFLMWAGGKRGQPYQKLGKAVGIAAVILSALLVVGALFTCLATKFPGFARSCPMMGTMMKEAGPGAEGGMGMGTGGGMGREMGRGGMGHGMGMRQMAPMPTRSEEGKEGESSTPKPMMQPPMGQGGPPSQQGQGPQQPGR